MDLRRFLRHVVMTPWTAARRFPSATLDAITTAIGHGEKTHRGQVRFVVEAELGTAQLWTDRSSRERAREVFAMTGVWDTEENSGVLVYVLLADRKVEIVADRGIQGRVDPGEWKAICGTMETAFRDGRFEAGAVEGVHAISALLARHFPSQGEHRDELPDRPILL